ncbi:MAG: hypothetical protein JST51_19295 [Armatimonadetes bacterium]|nr:hypothetical protein [Armatimonadota bacterium]
MPDDSTNKINNPLLLGSAMAASGFLGLICNKLLGGLIITVACNTSAFILGVALFREAWSKEFWGATRAWSGIWLIAWGLVGLLLTASTAYVNFGSPSREGYATMVTTLYAQQLFWFFGGIIMLILGITLVVRGLCLNPPRRL